MQSTPVHRRYSTQELAPMACDSADDVAKATRDGKTWLMNPKLDGWRLICVIEEDRVDMMTRGQKWQDGKLPYLEEALLARFPAGTILDGEICALREATPEERSAGRPAIINDFETVASIMGSNADKAVLKAKFNRPLTYHCFDLLQLGFTDFRGKPLLERLAVLKEWLAVPDDQYFQLTPYLEATQLNYDALVHMGFEGAVVKRADSVYLHDRRGFGWTKIKHEWTMDCAIMAFKPGRGKNTGKVGSFIFGQMRDGKLVERGHCRGFTDAVMEEATSNPDAYIGSVIEVAHRGAYPNGITVRHPQFKRMRPDKHMSECDWRDR
jgi:bifunctional non-homologous end joining protein LigD